jgi:DMSO/TMAO reductase YedYZ molybdopterin-dependent catalytic subunit
VRYLGTDLTPNEAFFSGTHFPPPVIDPRTWNLTIDGAVRHPMRLGYAALKKMPQHTVVATLECTGNGAVGFKKIAAGELPWENGAVGTAVWTSVPLTGLLRKRRIKRDATHIIIEG